MIEVKPAPPANINEFNQIAGLIFAQLYAQFPIIVQLIDRQAVADAFGVPGTDWAHKLPSGMSFSEILSYTTGWLVNQGYIVSFGSHPSERVTLTDKGLAALNATPSGLRATVGTELVKAKSEPSRRDWSQIGELVGSMLAGAAKSLSSC